MEQHDERLRHHISNPPPKGDIASFNRSEIAVVARLLAQAPCFFCKDDGFVCLGDEKDYDEETQAGLDVKDIARASIKLMESSRKGEERAYEAC